jgi:ATP-dependent DNA ligase
MGWIPPCAGTAVKRHSSGDSDSGQEWPIDPPMLLRTRAPAAGHVEPCLPSPAVKPPSGPGWIHEIKHEGHRMMARAGMVPATPRFPAIAEALSKLKLRSCLIDGEAIACDDNGLSVFQRGCANGRRRSYAPST